MVAGRPNSEESLVFAALDKGPSTGEGSRRNSPLGDSQVAQEPPEQAWTREEVPHVSLSGTLTARDRTAGRHLWSDGAWGHCRRLGPALALPHKHLPLLLLFTLYPDALAVAH